MDWLLGSLALGAHEGEPLEPQDLPTAWVFDPPIVAGLWSEWASLAIALISPLHPMGEVVGLLLFAAWWLRESARRLELAEPLATRAEE
ncbi:MAG: hypothetical protein KIT09_17760 [Bryobacteraceae bacterium]|nr:hypothetical protein [Bryobacteraceae bacterium]